MEEEGSPSRGPLSIFCFTRFVPSEHRRMGGELVLDVRRLGQPPALCGNVGGRMSDREWNCQPERIRTVGREREFGSGSWNRPQAKVSQ